MPAAAHAPTRDRLLAVLRGAPATVEDLAARLGVTRNAVRAQLAGLARAGLVEREGVLHRGGVGQPPAAYALTDAGRVRLSRAYPPAMAALATAIGRALPPARRRSLFAEAGRLLASGMPPVRGDAVRRAAALLEQLGGSASVTPHGGKAVIEGHDCPLGAAVVRCAESCELVRAMLAEATGARVATRCDHGSQPRCRFDVSE